MIATSPSRFSPLLRWMGITLVALLLLQMLAVLTLWDWNQEPFRQLVVERLINQSPMALVGLVLMYLSSRLEDEAESRTPVLWTVCIISGLLAVFLTASLPVAFGGDQIMQQQSDQQLAGKKGQLEMARQQSQDPALVQQLIKQAEASGQVPANASEAQKNQSARAFIDRQLDQMEAQFKQTEQASKVALSQRRFAGSGGAVVLIIAFTILCLGSVL
ncbi:MAG: HpsJ family protein [Cyanobacteria bacterium]|nr:HpsJ family protein [Cyanobacteriota bacterium]